jgi:hypothetical protein
MLKTISAALLAVSVLTAPAFAANSDKTTQAPAAKTTQAPVDKAARTTLAPADKAAQVKPKAAQVKPSALNANAKMSRHRHHRSHKHMGALKTHKVSKASIKHIGPATKRG